MSSAALRSVRAFRFSLKPPVSKFRNRRFRNPDLKSVGFEIRPIHKTTSTKKKEIECFSFEMGVILSNCRSKPDAGDAN